MARMGNAQTALGRASTEIEAYRRHHAQLTSTCSQKQSARRTAGMPDAEMNMETVAPLMRRCKDW